MARFFFMFRASFPLIILYFVFDLSCSVVGACTYCTFREARHAITQSSYNLYATLHLRTINQHITYTLRTYKHAKQTQVISVLHNVKAAITF